MKLAMDWDNSTYQVEVNGTKYFGANFTKTTDNRYDDVRINNSNDSITGPSMRLNTDLLVMVP